MPGRRFPAGVSVARGGPERHWPSCGWPSSRRRPRRSPPLTGLCRPPLLLTMLLGGLWHGASWNFVLWGGLHGSYLTIERILRGEGKAAPAGWTTARAWLKATWIFVLVSVTWVFFRSPSLEVTRIVWEKLLFLDGAGLAWWFVPAVLSVPATVLGGFLARRWEWRFTIVATWSPLLPAVLVLGASLVFFFAALDSSPFIYFQF